MVSDYPGFGPEKPPIDPSRPLAGVAGVPRSAQDIDRIAHLEKCLAQARAELVEERNTSKRFRDRLHICIDEMKIEADHATLRSTEAAMDLRDLASEADDRDMERMIEDEEGPKERDYIAELKASNETNHTLRKALITAQRQETELLGKLNGTDRRNRDLLEANNRYLEKARSARMLLRKYLGCGFPSGIRATREEVEAELADPITRY